MLNPSILRRRLGLIAALAALLLGASATSASGQTLLRHKFAPGETIRYELSQKITDTVNQIPAPEANADPAQAKPEKRTTKSSIVMTMSSQVQNVSDQGTATVIQTIDRVQIEIKGSGAELAYDSSDPKNGTSDANPATVGIHKFLSILVGAPFTQDITAVGKVENIKIPEGVIAKLRANSPSQGSGGMFSEERVKELISQASMQAPSTPLSPGQGWKDQLRTAAPPIGTIVTDRSYTFRGPHATYPNFDHIEMKGMMSFEKAPNVPDQIQLTVDKFDGAYLFDAKAGRVSYSSLTQKFTVSNGADNGQKVTQTIEQIVTMRLLANQ